jgi:hypothetical protein
MGQAGRAVADVVLFLAMAGLFLAPVHLFAAYRLRRARSRRGGAYVARLDPWLPAVVAGVGAGVLALLRLVS